MVFNGLRLGCALEGSSNFISRKDHMEVVFDDTGLLDYVNIDIPKPGLVDAKNLAQ